MYVFTYVFLKLYLLFNNTYLMSCERILPTHGRLNKERGIYIYLQCVVYATRCRDSMDCRRDREHYIRPQVIKDIFVNLSFGPERWDIFFFNYWKSRFYRSSIKVHLILEKISYVIYIYVLL